VSGLAAETGIAIFRITFERELRALVSGPEPDGAIGAGADGRMHKAPLPEIAGEHLLADVAGQAL